MPVNKLNNYFMSFVIIIINPEFKVLENTPIKQITRFFVYLGVFIRGAEEKQEEGEEQAGQRPFNFTLNYTQRQQTGGGGVEGL